MSQTKVGGTAQTSFTFDSGKRWRTAQAPCATVAAVPTDPDRTTYAYTGTGRLAEYTKYSGGTAAVSATYSYDASGQRTDSVVTQGAITTSVHYVYTGLTLQKLTGTQTGGDQAGSWSITYLYEEYGRPYAGIYRDTTQTEDPPAPVVFAIVTSDRGDVLEVLDSSGNPFAAYRYDAWGNPLGTGNVPGTTGLWAQATTDAQQNEVISLTLATQICERQVLRYAGYSYDQESGLYYLSCRHYDPATRQFLSKDLSRNDGEQSAYQYCLGNPVTNVDPTGFQCANDKAEADRRHRNAIAWRNYYEQQKQREARGWSTYELLGHWLDGTAPQTIQYEDGDKAMAEMRNSPLARKMRDAFTASLCSAGPYSDPEPVVFETGEAFKKTVLPKVVLGGVLGTLFGGPIWGGVAAGAGGADAFDEYPAQVGGVGGATVKRDKSGLFVTYRIENEITTGSFYYHHPGWFGYPEEIPYGRPQGTVTQVWEWVEPIPSPGVVGGIA